MHSHVTVARPGRRVTPAASSAADVVDMPPLAGAVDLDPAVLPADLVDDPAHLGALEVDRTTELMRGGAGRVGRRAVAGEKRAVELRLLLVGAVGRERATGADVGPVGAQRVRAHRVPGVRGR